MVTALLQPHSGADGRRLVVAGSARKGILPTNVPKADMGEEG